MKKLATVVLNVVLAVSSLLAPAVPSGAAPVPFRGGSVGVPLTPCRIGLWWDGLCNDACGVRVCVFVGHWKLVCADAVVFDFMWMEVSVESDDGGPPDRCLFVIGDQPKGGPYERKTYVPRCIDSYRIQVDVGWSGDEPDIRAVSCVER
jgi:hypothetical protein